MKSGKKWNKNSKILADATRIGWFKISKIKIAIWFVFFSFEGENGKVFNVLSFINVENNF